MAVDMRTVVSMRASSSVLLGLLICCVSGLNIRTYEAPKTDMLFQRLVVDTATDDVYASARNALYRFNTHLQPVDYNRTGPYLDAPACDPGAAVPCNGRRSTDNDAVVLELVPGTERRVLYCGTVLQGLCSVFPMDDLTKGAYLDPGNKVNFVGSRSGETFAYFASGSDNPRATALYVGQAFDQRPEELSPMAVSARRLLPSREPEQAPYNISYLYENVHQQIYTAIDIDPLYKPSYQVDYIYGFDHGDFAYFVTVQRVQAICEGPHCMYESRLVRVCKKDHAFNSYAEVKLSCKKKNGVLTFYNIAQAAYVAEIGRELSDKFDIEYDESMLYIVFGVNDQGGREPIPKYGSGLCMFSMSEVESYFSNVQKECYRGLGSILPWIDSREVKCQGDVSI